MWLWGRRDGDRQHIDKAIEAAGLDVVGDQQVRCINLDDAAIPTVRDAGVAAVTELFVMPSRNVSARFNQKIAPSSTSA